MTCIFCKIVQGEIPCNKVYEDDSVIAFRDLHPQAPHHLLIIPRKHVSTLNDFSEEDLPLMGSLVLAANKIAASLGVDKKGYRLVTNCNEDGGQTVFHVHVHFLAGRSLTWPPG